MLVLALIDRFLLTVRMTRAASCRPLRCVSPLSCWSGCRGRRSATRPMNPAAQGAVVVARKSNSCIITSLGVTDAAGQQEFGAGGGLTHGVMDDPGNDGADTHLLLTCPAQRSVIIPAKFYHAMPRCHGRETRHPGGFIMLTTGLCGRARA